jgi:uncharacterized membrane protein YraQ (UPF0718 family)
MNERVLNSWVKTKQTIKVTAPLVLGMILLISCLDLLLNSKWILALFQKNVFLDSLIGGAVGSLATGNPITSYILGGEFLQAGVSLVAVTAFILTWVTVGLVQLPAESMMLGKKYAITRNVLSFVSAIIMALIAQLILG